MSDQPVQTAPHVSDKTRDNLAYLWSGAIIIFVGYILWRFGDFKEILTLLIGFISGTASTILALYFGGVLGKPGTPPPSPGQVDVAISASTTPIKPDDEPAT